MRLIPVLALPLALGFAVPGDRVAFAPEEGTELKKTFTTELELNLEDLSVSTGGQELDPSMLGNFEITVDYNHNYEVSDEYAEMGDGLPKKLVRSFDALGGAISFSFANDMMGDEEQSMETASELEGTTVVFTWDDEADDYAKAFDGDDGDEELLENLEEDMDLRVLLPEDEVAEGDSWEIELRNLESVVAPGGDLSLLPTEETEEAEMPEEFTEMLEGAFEDFLDELLEGTAKATYGGTREEGDTEVGVINLEVELDASTDFSELMSDVINAAKEMEEEAADVDISIDVADLEISFEGEATLLWNNGSGHLHSFELTGELFVALDLAMNIVMQEMEMSNDVSVEFSGSYASSIEVE